MTHARAQRCARAFMQGYMNVKTSYKILDPTAVKEYVNTWFVYNKASGTFSWKKMKKGRNVRVGGPVGTEWISPEGTKYLFMRVLGRSVRQHNVVWLLEKGYWPIHELDHKDGDGANNRIGNLRDVPHSTNSKNMRLNRKNTAGCAGVRWNKAKRKWQARIHRDGKDWWLGLFDNIEDAISVRKNAETEIGYHENHGTNRKRHV